MIESLKHTPLHDIHVELGARMTAFAGFDMPVQYSGIIDEHRAVRDRAGIFDVSHMGEVTVRGPKAIDFVQKLVTNDAAQLYDGKAMYTVMCRPSGGIVDDLLVYRISETEYMLVINAANIDKDVAWMRENAVEGAELINRSDEIALIAVQGPASHRIVSRAAGIDLSDLTFYHFARPSTFLDFEEVIVSHTGYTGELGLEIYCKPEAAAQIWNAIMEAGAQDGITACGLGARDTLRIEAGYALYGNDITEETNPLEAGLGWLVKLNKGSFIGSDALTAVKESKPDRKLIGFVLEERGIPRPGLPIAAADGVEIGTVTSGTQSPVLQKGIGMGYVPNLSSYTAEDAEIQIVSRGRMLKARVTRPPFHKK